MRLLETIRRIANRIRTRAVDALLRDRVEIRGRFDVALYDVDDLRREIDDWDDLGKLEKHRALRDSGVDPVESQTTWNTTVEGLHSYIVDNLDPGQNVNESASHLAVGRDNTGPTTSDAALGDEVYRTEITEVIDNGRDLTTSTFLDSTEANVDTDAGEELREAAIYTDTAANGGFMLNRALITEIAKDDSKTATVDVELQFRAA